ncbi:MAG: hypothetical protein ACRDOG_04230 [Gaiellaceae bacterium]
MRRIALFSLAIVLGASGCQAWTGASGSGSAAEGGTEAEERAAAIYAAVVRQLVTEDHTFGAGPSPYRRAFVADGVVRDAGDPLAGNEKPAKRFSAAIKREILAALRDLRPVRFVADPDTVVVDCRVERRGVLISLGTIGERSGDAVTVANNLFSGCKGGRWQTYVLKPRDGSWRVVGTTGPIAIS